MEYCKLALAKHRAIECNQSKPLELLYVIVLYVIDNMAYIMHSFLIIILTIVSVA